MKKRCEYDNCNKVLELSSFPCKCNKMFCSLHRSNYDHSCNFNYIDEHKRELLKVYSTAIIAKKLEKI